MTNLEAIKALLNYPLSDNAFILALSDRGLTHTSIYDTSTDKMSLELTKADLIYVMCAHPNITEGGYTLTISDKPAILGIANGIYKKYGVSIPGKKTAKFVQKW